MRSTFCWNLKPLLSRAIAFSNRVVRNCVLCSGELVTEFTDCAERQTQQLTGTAIDRKLTARTIELVGCGSKADPPVSQALVRQVRQLNRDGIQLVDGLIAFKERLLRSVCSCSLFTSNYPPAHRAHSAGGQALPRPPDAPGKSEQLQPSGAL